MGSLDHDPFGPANRAYREALQKSVEAGEMRIRTRKEGTKTIRTITVCPAAEAEPATPGIALDDEDEKTLRVMALAPTRLWSIADLSARSQVSDKPVGERVNRMIAQGLAVRPRGPRKGVQVTERGLAVAQAARPL